MGWKLAGVEVVLIAAFLAAPLAGAKPLEKISCPPRAQTVDPLFCVLENGDKIAYVTAEQRWYRVFKMLTINERTLLEDLAPPSARKIVPLAALSPVQNADRSLAAWYVPGSGQFFHGDRKQLVVHDCPVGFGIDQKHNKACEDFSGSGKRIAYLAATGAAGKVLGRSDNDLRLELTAEGKTASLWVNYDDLAFVRVATVPHWVRGKVERENATEALLSFSRSDWWVWTNKANIAGRQ